MPNIKVFNRLIPPFQQLRQITETKLDQINFTKDHSKLHLSSSNNNLNLYTISDIPPDETI